MAGISLVYRLGQAKLYALGCFPQAIARIRYGALAVRLQHKCFVREVCVGWSRRFEMPGLRRRLASRTQLFRHADKSHAMRLRKQYRRADRRAGFGAAAARGKSPARSVGADAGNRRSPGTRSRLASPESAHECAQ